MASKMHKNKEKRVIDLDKYLQFIEFTRLQLEMHSMEVKESKREPFVKQSYFLTVQNKMLK